MIKRGMAMGLCAMALVWGAEQARAVADSAPTGLEIETVWSGHPVGFSLLTTGTVQYVAYYDAERHMKLACRDLPDGAWAYAQLPSRLGWDSHNDVVMTLDRAGHLHVTGNMHGNPLVYFRSGAPGDIQTLQRVETMVDPATERRVTYPKFFNAPDGRLVFKYRDGGSGNGSDIYNVYDEDARSWSRLLDVPLLDGLGRVNGYFSIPSLGPDGRFHIVGVWRDTPDAATNHSLSYARSADLLAWQTAAGASLALPLTMENIDIVDPVPARGGMINGNARLGFDSRQRPIVTYHKFDADGWTQIYAARFEGDRWNRVQVSEWDGYRWEFGGGGSIPFEVRIGPVQPHASGRLALSFSRRGESGVWELDEETLLPVGRMDRAPDGVPRDARVLRSDFPGMSIRMAHDIGPGDAEGVRYVLAWETLGPNRDRPREGDLPEPSMLRLYPLGQE